MKTDRHMFISLILAGFTKTKLNKKFLYLVRVRVMHVQYSNKSRGEIVYK